jgi:hypothetical protein
MRRASRLDRPAPEARLRPKVFDSRQHRFGRTLEDGHRTELADVVHFAVGIPPRYAEPLTPESVGDAMDIKSWQA